ncbi:MAG: hypothetical protein EOM54_08055 [Clostridia bacterium]|nr:hypothetical protein [Clostridia bacterium]
MRSFIRCRCFRALQISKAENNYIFKWDDGRPFVPDLISRKFDKLLKHYGFHELSHSCASFLINSGCSLKYVQKWLGHSDIKMTANIYAHFDVSRKKNMADLPSRHLIGQPEKC